MESAECAGLGIVDRANIAQGVCEQRSGIADRANIAQGAGASPGYPGSVSPVPRRRRTHAVYAGHGVVIGRVEDDARLWHGMKDGPAVVVPERGALEFLYRGRTYQQHPGVLQLKQAGEIYRDLRRDGPATYQIVLFDPAVVAAARGASGAGELVFETPVLAVTDPRAAALLALCRLTERADALAVESAIVEAALALVALGGSPYAVGHEQRAVQRARAYLLERLAEPIRLDDVADHVGMDKYHLIRAFRADVGVPPYTFVTHARVHRARELLRGGISAASAATAVGFCDQSQLHRHFVRLVGMTPGRYAAAARTSLRSSITLAFDRGREHGIVTDSSVRATSISPARLVR
jgi:AraC-like DNA-binding protein